MKEFCGGLDFGEDQDFNFPRVGFSSMFGPLYGKQRMEKHVISEQTTPVWSGGLENPDFTFH